MVARRFGAGVEGARVVSAGVCETQSDEARTRRSSPLVFELEARDEPACRRSSSSSRRARRVRFWDRARLDVRRHTRARATFRVATLIATSPRGVSRVWIVDRPSAPLADPRDGLPRISFVVVFPLQQPLALGFRAPAQIPPHGGRGFSRALRPGALVHARGPRAAPDAPRRERRAHRLQPPRGARRPRYPRAPPGRARPRLDPHPPRHPLLRTPAPRPPRRALRRRLLEPRARASPRVRRHRGAHGPAQIRPRVR